MQELTRRVASAKAWGIEPVSLVTPAEVKELVPFIDETVILGGFYTPVRRRRRLASRRARSCASAGSRTGGSRVLANTEVVGIDVERGRVRRLRTTGGDIETDIVVIACGVWSPKLARMAGASIPLTPAVHQMIDIGPTHWFADTKGDIDFPIVRDMDTNMYERQEGTGLEVGSYAHRADPVRPRGPALGGGGRAHSDRVPVHAGGLHAADGARARADAVDRRRRERRDQVRGQRDPLPHPRRHADPRRAARGEGAVVGRRGVGQGRARRGQVGRRVDGARRVAHRPPLLRRRALLGAPEDLGRT